MMLLPDGRVMAVGYNAGQTSKNWYALTPDSTGDYVNGTWSTLASMSLERLFFASNVLPSGKVLVQGGEYSDPFSDQNLVNSGQIYDPATNKWSNIATFPQPYFGDDPTILLPDGKILAGYIFSSQTYLYNPATNSWTPTGAKLRGDRSDEETWTLLPDGSVLSYDVFASPAVGPGSAQRYIPSTGTWVDAGVVPVPLSGPNYGYEFGPGLVLPDGRVLEVGTNGNTAIYTPSTNTWVAGPIVPGGYLADDCTGGHSSERQCDIRGRRASGYFHSADEDFRLRSRGQYDNRYYPGRSCWHRLGRRLGLSRSACSYCPLETS